jgi:hypothetical protein
MFLINLQFNRQDTGPHKCGLLGVRVPNYTFYNCLLSFDIYCMMNCKLGTLLVAQWYIQVHKHPHMSSSLYRGVIHFYKCHRDLLILGKCCNSHHKGNINCSFLLCFLFHIERCNLHWIAFCYLLSDYNMYRNLHFQCKYHICHYINDM